MVTEEDLGILRFTVHYPPSCYAAVIPHRCTLYMLHVRVEGTFFGT